MASRQRPVDTAGWVDYLFGAVAVLALIAVTGWLIVP